MGWLFWLLVTGSTAILAPEWVFWLWVTGTAIRALRSRRLATSSSSSSERSDNIDERMLDAVIPSSSSSCSNGRSTSLQSFGNTKQYTLPRMIKIMSYNVWPEDIEIHARMKSISSLILKHSPDVVFFQEITPEIYEIFRSFKWGKLYNCSVSPDEAETKKYFPMLLSKLPAEFLNCKQFRKATGKEIIIAKIEPPGLTKEFLVANIHMKSPAFPEMHKEERTAQAEEAIKLLDIARNVVFGGDMNWDDESDGRFPLLDGWVDAWTELKGGSGEDGWTFDTRANPMLKGHRKLQKRLDRFMCKLRDFRMVSVEMIGLDAIAGLYAENKYGKMAPVLPSDHFGLLLTICTK
ncbi:uncharacterized protein [Typha latifolia]|uniref:uncharacterized protein n=1 Tax=Typha latifolia TaxID=4733 RepID=UPI003C2BF05F